MFRRKRALPARRPIPHHKPLPPAGSPASKYRQADVRHEGQNYIVVEHLLTRSGISAIMEEYAISSESASETGQGERPSQGHRKWNSGRGLRRRGRIPAKHGSSPPLRGSNGPLG